MNKMIFSVVIIAAILSTIYGCKKDPQIIDVDNKAYILEYGLLPPPPIAQDNQLTQEGVKLGRMLFYETMLSRTNTQSCASCHIQQFAFSDTATFSIGVNNLQGKRQAMSVFNMAWHTNEFFWDGRAHLLRDQSLMPIQDHLEMDENLPNVVAKLKADARYTSQFKRAFGSEEVNPLLMSKAMEQFMNSIVSYRSKYDLFLAGKATLSTQEERGRYLFFNEFSASNPSISGADCQHCHGGLNFELNRYTNNGLDGDANFVDIGREKVTNNTADRAKFKIPSLRNIEFTAPYMHDGRFKTLEEVIQHYNSGLVNSSTLDPAMVPSLGGLKLNAQDVQALVAFLKTLSDYELINDSRYSSPF